MTQRYFVSALVLLTCCPAQAETSTPNALANLYACIGQADDARRLVCYDAAAKALRAAEARRDVVAIDRNAAHSFDHESFGLQLPSLTRLLGGPQTGTEQSFEIAKVVQRSGDLADFVMTDGQIWSQTEAQYSGRVRAGAHAIIKRAALGSYLLQIQGLGAPFRVRRAQ